MDFEQVIKLIECVDTSNVANLRLKMDQFEIEISKDERIKEDIRKPKITIDDAKMESTQIENEQECENTESYITAPLMGTFYRAPAPEEAPFVEVGTTVRKGDVVGLLEAMKMINEIQAPYDCIIEDILVENGTLASFEAPVFAVKRL